MGFQLQGRIQGDEPLGFFRQLRLLRERLFRIRFQGLLLLLQGVDLAICRLDGWGQPLQLMFQTLDIAYGSISKLHRIGAFAL